MITFKQYLQSNRIDEGGKATAKYGTVRATKSDIEAALLFVSKATGISLATLKDNLLGSGSQTLAGTKKDSGDIDIAIHDDKNRSSIEDAMKSAVGISPRKTGGNVLSYAVPVGDERRVQVDLMFVPSLDWAKFSYHSEPGSRFKGAIRNLLIYALVLNSQEKDKDVRVKSDDGHDMVRASRSFQLDTGLKRVFKVAPMRKDGKGRVKTAVDATPAEVAATLKSLGRSDKFSKDEDTIRDPDKFAKMLLGAGASAKDLKTSAEELIKTIKKKRPDAAKVFKDALSDIDRQKLFADDEEARKLFVKLSS